jgi:tetratricopeptide (TPR) repeat protein
MKATILGVTVCGLLVAGAGAFGAATAGEKTGTHAGGDAPDPLTLQLNPAERVERIRQLLDDGRAAEAVQAARDYAARFEDGRERGDVRRMHYDALNALCVTLTKTGSLDEAADVCTQAMDLLPRQWTAINNRGTAHFAAGRYEQALADYRRARDVAPPRQENVLATIDHNIELAETRLEP